MDKKKNILICPLEWGLGHAGRMIPLAKELQKRNNNVITACGKAHQELFRRELPDATYISFSGFRPGYSRVIPQYIFILLKLPILFYHIVVEHFRLKLIIRKHKIDIVISDNRFGLWSRKVKSVYVTHMPVIPLPDKLRHLEWIGVMFHRFFIKKYSLCLIPDLPGKINLSGRLSHGLKLPSNVRFVGILSRFSGLDRVETNKFNYPHHTVVLSGPEPQRSILRKKLITALRHGDTKTVVLEGKPGPETRCTENGKIIFYNHLTTAEMMDVLLSSSSIITRSGYTSIMELISLKCSAMLIPTPGQTEQEYLAEYLSYKGWFLSIPQREIGKLLTLCNPEPSWPSMIIEESRGLLEKALDEILDQ